MTYIGGNKKTKPSIICFKKLVYLITINKFNLTIKEHKLIIYNF